MGKIFFIGLLALSLICGAIGVLLKVNHSQQWISDLVLAVSTLSWFAIIADVLMIKLRQKTPTAK
jgi:hypothetical protein